MITKDKDIFINKYQEGKNILFPIIALISFLNGFFYIFVLCQYKNKGFIKNNLIFGTIINFIFGFGFLLNLYFKWFEKITIILDIITGFFQNKIVKTIF